MATTHQATAGIARLPAARGRDESHRARHSLLGRWIVAFIGGEIVGFGLAAPAGALAARANDGVTGGRAVAIAISGGLVAGLVEGSAVGWAQWRVLRRVIPSIDRRAWIVATAAGAALAWAIGMTLGTTAAPDEEPLFLIVAAVAGVLGAALGALLGAGQWVVLRGHVPRAGRWIVANAAGWFIGLVVAFGGAGLSDESTPVALIILTAALTGAAMAVIPAFATGLALLAFADEASGAPGKTASGQPRRNRFANRLLVPLLRSRFHRLVSGRLLLVTMVSPISGRRVTFPVAYTRSPAGVTIISRRDHAWWRGVAAGQPATLRIRGCEIPATGTVVTDEAAVAAMKRARGVVIVEFTIGSP